MQLSTWSVRQLDNQRKMSLFFSQILVLHDSGLTEKHIKHDRQYKTLKFMTHQLISHLVLPPPSAMSMSSLSSESERAASWALSACMSRRSSYFVTLDGILLNIAQLYSATSADKSKFRFLTSVKVSMEAKYLDHQSSMLSSSSSSSASSPFFLFFFFPFPSLSSSFSCKKKLSRLSV